MAAPRMSSFTSSVSVPSTQIDRPDLSVNAAPDHNRTPPLASELAGSLLQRVISTCKGNGNIGRFQLTSDLRTLERVQPKASLLEPFSICYDQILDKVENEVWFQQYEERFDSIAEPWFQLGQAEVYAEVSTSANANRHPTEQRPVPTVNVNNDIDPTLVPSDHELEAMIAAAGTTNQTNVRPRVTASVQPWMAPTSQNISQGLDTSLATKSIITRSNCGQSSASAATDRNETFTVRDVTHRAGLGGSTDEQRQFLQSLAAGSWQRRYCGSFALRRLLTRVLNNIER